MKNDDERTLEFDRQEPNDSDNEIDKAFKNLITAVEGQAAKERQRQIEAYSTEELRKRIVAESVVQFQKISASLTSIIAVLKILEATDEIELGVMLQMHAELQARVLRNYRVEGMPESDAQVVSDLLGMDTEFIDSFIKRHSGDHAGCVLDEYRKRVNEDWPEQVEDLGGDDYGIN